MTKALVRFGPLLASALALCVGCAPTVEDGAEWHGGDELDLRAQTEFLNCCPDEIESSVTSLGSNEYLIVYRATLNSPECEIWTDIRNFENLISISFPGQTSSFQWLNGGGPNQIPSLVQFDLGTQTIVEEVFYRSDAAEILKYRVAVTPVLGIEEYTAEIKLSSCGTDTLFTITRQVTLSSGVSVNDFLPMFEQEVVDTQTYFESDNEYDGC